MKKFMKLTVAAALLSTAPAMATTVVLNGIQNAIANPVAVNLTAGTYDIEFLEFSPTVKTLNRFGATTNWEARFAYRVGSDFTIYNLGSLALHNTDALAFAAVSGQIFKLDVATDATYRFFISDSAPANNIGGIRFNISLPPSIVPEPATWAFMILGFGMVGGVMRSRARAALA